MKIDLFREVVSKKDHRCNVINKFGYSVAYNWVNSNKLLNGYFDGVKTGNTPSAGPCLCCSFVYKDFNVTTVITGCKHPDVRWKEMALLVLWAFDKHLKRGGNARKTRLATFITKPVTANATK